MYVCKSAVRQPITLFNCKIGDYCSMQNGTDHIRNCIPAIFHSHAGKHQNQNLPLTKKLINNHRKNKWQL